MCITLVLQTCTDSLYILPGSPGESHATSSDGACNFSNVGDKEDVGVKEEGFIAVNEEADTGTKQEEIREDVNFLDRKAEPDGVSHMCVCLLLDIFYRFPAMSAFFFEVSISGHLNKNVLL